MKLNLILSMLILPATANAANLRHRELTKKSGSRVGGQGSRKSGSKNPNVDCSQLQPGCCCLENGMMSCEADFCNPPTDNDGIDNKGLVTDPSEEPIDGKEVDYISLPCNMKKPLWQKCISGHECQSGCCLELGGGSLEDNNACARCGWTDINPTYVGGINQDCEAQSRVQEEEEEEPLEPTRDGQGCLVSTARITPFPHVGYNMWNGVGDPPRCKHKCDCTFGDCMIKTEGSTEMSMCVDLEATNKKMGGWTIAP
mmetsp:Transcript_23942/g.49452  ORF Transcript_23942/g.49452 Transcript_23942/m.49452 type:complete len:256 (+) Transcript_23942:116-883(+)